MMVQCNRNTKSFAAVSILFILIILVMYGTLDRRLQMDEDHSASFYKHSSPNRLDKYCNKEIPKRKVSNELSSNWKLVYLALNIRHGDRSPIHNIPGTVSESSHSANALIDDKVLGYIPSLANFRLSTLQSRTEIPDTARGEILSNTLNPSIVMKIPGSDYLLGPGQLTSRGYMQHIHLGDHLRTFYSLFLKELGSVNELYVRSTNYARTIQSAAALLTTLLAPGGRGFERTINGLLPIHVYENEEEEYMHGIGFRSSSHSVTDYTSHTQERTLQGDCAKSTYLAGQQKLSFTPAATLMSVLQQRLGPQIYQKGITELADSSLPGYCHAQPLPCKPYERSAANSCLLEQDLTSMMLESDRYYCGRFAGDEGGYAATKLSMYPFLREVVGHLVTASVGKTLNVSGLYTSNELPSTAGASHHKKVSVFSGHDTVIAPVLSSLGVYRHEALCKWPGYASRIVFEVWQHTSHDEYSQQQTRKQQQRSLSSPHVQSGEATGDAAAATARMNTDAVFRGLKLVYPLLFDQITAATTEVVAEPPVLAAAAAAAAPSRSTAYILSSVTARQSSYIHSFIRINFNGQDITSLVPTCISERELQKQEEFTTNNRRNHLKSRARKERSSGSHLMDDHVQQRQYIMQQIRKEKTTLCSLDALVRQVHSLLGDSSSISEACKI